MALWKERSASGMRRMRGPSRLSSSTSWPGARGANTTTSWWRATRFASSHITMVTEPVCASLALTASRGWLTKTTLLMADDSASAEVDITYSVTCQNVIVLSHLARYQQ